MNSPFPGMDPYLESHWGDVHLALIAYARDVLQTRLPNDLRARMQERVLIQPPEDTPSAIYPDVRVVERRRSDEGAGGVAVLVEEETATEPIVLTLGDGPIKGFIEIVEAGSRDRVVTVIEVLSPSNKKRGKDRDDYLRKREELEDGGVGLVEIDLLRWGHRTLGHERLDIPASHRTTYQVCVRHGYRPGVYEVYRAPLRERLPKIRVPLRRTDRDVTLDLQALVDQAYRNGRYDDINYRVDPAPPLEPEDAAWADALLREKGRR